MLALVHSAPKTLAPYRCPSLGVLSSPRRFYRDVGSWPWAADNDAFGAWDDDRFRRMLDGLSGLSGGLFVTMPDVVGDAAATLDLFDAWLLEARLAQQPLALVAQDGLTPDAVPWRYVGAVFVGGSTEWKMGAAAREIVTEARARGRWVHMGRVNSQQRMRYAKAIGCDSIDGTSLSWFRDRYLQRFIDHAAAPPQMLIDHAAPTCLATEGRWLPYMGRPRLEQEMTRPG